MLQIKYIDVNCFQERSSIVWDEDGFCAFVDPGAETEGELQQLTDMISSKNLKPVAIMLTLGCKEDGKNDDCCHE